MGTFAKLPVQFGRYHVEKLLGRGAMGAVYLAHDTQLERQVALKIPRLSAAGSAKLLQRLKTEAKAAAQIDHPNVCPVYDSGDIEGTPFIAMKYIEGETLKDHLLKEGNTPRASVQLVIHLAEGLAEAHSKGIYHRDLKPENIKLDRRGVPVIMDFGLAKLTATVSAGAGKTQSGTILGSPAYMSPEQAVGSVEEIDCRSDLYSLGVILYELLTGKWPFTGGAVQVMAQKSMLDPPSPLTLKPELNARLAAVCHKLIARKPEDRYQTAKELLAVLTALDPESQTRESSPSIPLAQSPSESVADWWREKPRGMKWVGLASGVLTVGLIGLWAGGAFIEGKTREGTPVIPVNEPETPLPSSDLDRVANGKWIRLVDSQTVLSDPQKMRFQNGILELDNTRMEFPEINARDVILRAQVRKVSGQNLGIHLRRGAGNFGAFFAGADQLEGDYFGIGKNASGQTAKGWSDLANTHIGRKFQPDQFVEMAFAAIGDTLTLYVDGTKVLTVKNSEVASGMVGLGAHKGKSLFKDVEYQILDPVPLGRPR